MTRWGLQIASEAEDDLLAGAFAEFVVTDGSPLAGNPAASDMLAGQSAALVAVSRRGKAIAEALAVQAPQAGDVLLLQVAADRVPASAGAMGLLPLADRPIRLGLAPRDLLPLLALLGAIAAAGAGLTSLGLGLLVGGVLAVTMAVTPFLNNAAAVLIMAPIAASAGQASGVPVDALLRAVGVGVGASCDFLTPIGHQSDVLVWGPGGYQFGDYARIGAPISLMVLLLGTPLILWAWS